MSIPELISSFSLSMTTPRQPECMVLAMLLLESIREPKTLLGPVARTGLAARMLQIAEYK